jgi:hypothetical protein
MRTLLLVTVFFMCVSISEMLLCRQFCVTTGNVCTEFYRKVINSVDVTVLCFTASITVHVVKSIYDLLEVGRSYQRE